MNNNIIELFELILKRNRLTRDAHNAKTYRARYLKRLGVEDVKFVRPIALKLEKLTFNREAARNILKAFTKANLKRRRQLSKLLNTQQGLQSNNVITSIRVLSIDYTEAEMKSYLIDNILLRS